MPTYSYQCQMCGHTQDEQRAMADRDNAPVCKKCQKPMIRKYVAVPFKVRVTHISEL